MLSPQPCEQAVVIGIAFPRYLKETVNLLEIAKKSRATVLALAGKSSFPVAPLSIHLLIRLKQPPNAVKIRRSGAKPNRRNSFFRLGASL